MKRGIRRAAAFGLALTLVCLSAAPAVAAPRTEAPPRFQLLKLQDFAAHVAGLFEGWVRSVFAPTDVTGDPNG